MCGFCPTFIKIVPNRSRIYRKCAEFPAKMLQFNATLACIAPVFNVALCGISHEYIYSTHTEYKVGEGGGDFHTSPTSGTLHTNSPPWVQFGIQKFRSAENQLRVVPNQGWTGSSVLIGGGTGLMGDSTQPFSTLPQTSPVQPNPCSPARQPTRTQHTRGILLLEGWLLSFFSPFLP